MGTGAQFVNFKNKMLVGFEDLGTRMIGYLRQSHIESVQSRWDVDGVFNTKLTMSGSAANELQINGTSKATDGLGHILDINEIFSRNVLFENTAAIAYYVALFYAEVPAEIRINPRTGAPQYDRLEEVIGKSAAPTSVTDNGNGTITFNVNSVAEAGVSNNGRFVRVFMNTPAPGATTAAIAVEELQITYGTNNEITTTGALGQTSISTTAADYTVVLMGASVSKNTDLSTVSGACFIGTVTGNGGTPATFDNTLQSLIKTFTDATQINYTPISWLAPGATTVQAALDAIVNGMQANGTGTANGASRVGINPGAYGRFLNVPTESVIGGIGNQTEGTLSSTATVADALANVDEQLQNVRTFSTYTRGGRSADYDTNANAENMLGNYSGLFVMKALPDPDDDPYAIGGTEPSDASVYVLGEDSYPTKLLLASRPVLNFQRTGGTSIIPTGKWQRVYIDAPAGSYVTVNGPGRASGGIFEDVIFHGGRIALTSMDTASDSIMPFELRNCVIDPGADTTHSFAYSLAMMGYSNQPMFGKVSNTVMMGLPDTVTSPTPVADFVWDSTIGATSIEGDPDYPTKFENCVFISQRVDIPLLYIGARHKVVFDNCHFHGISGQTVAQMVQVAAGAEPIFRDCVFYGKEGGILNADQCYGLYERCLFITGTGGTAISNPKVITANGGADRPLTFRDCTVLINTSALRDSATANALVQFGSFSTGDGILSVDGLCIQYTGGSYVAAGETLLMVGSAYASFRNISVDFNGLGSDNSAGPAASHVPTISSCCVGAYVVGTSTGGSIDGISLDNYTQPTAGHLVDHALFAAILSKIQNVFTRMVDGGTKQIMAELLMNGGCWLSGFQSATTDTYAKGIIVTDSHGNTMNGVQIGNPAFPVSPQDPGVGSSKPLMVWIQGNENTLDGFYITTDGTGNDPEVTNAGRDVQILNGRIHALGSSRNNGCIYAGAARGITIANISGFWDATAKPFVHLSSNDSTADNIIVYRSAGATGAVSDTGTGNTVGTVISRATL